MRNLEIGKTYRHFKGKFYIVKDIATHFETLEEYVVYQALYGDYKTYIRPLNMFIEKIDSNRADNIFKQNYRFERIDVNDWY